MTARRFYPLVVGLLLGVMQTGLFFQLTFTLSSSFGTYLMVLLAWLVGSAAGVVVLSRAHLPTRVFLLVALWAYLAVCLLLSIAPFQSAFWPVYAALVLANGLYAGVFFGRMSPAYTARALLLWENNGFILGLVGTTVLFMLMGRALLWAAPIVVALVVAALHEPQANAAV
jgi:hypothetical protein